MIFVDTNYFLRFLLEDINEQHQEAKELFQSGAEGGVKLATSIIVLFEIYWVLQSFYQKRKDRLVSILRDILDLQFIQLEGRRLLQEALVTFEQTALELEDCFNLVYAKELGAAEFKTFDQKLAKQFKKS